jgi:transposase
MLQLLARSGRFAVVETSPARPFIVAAEAATSGAKNDPTDAQFALELLLRHPDKLTRLEPESVPMRSLRRLVEARRTRVQDGVRVTNPSPQP